MRFTDKDIARAVLEGYAAGEANTARDLLASLRAILPYAESRAEDMQDCADALAEDAENFDIDDKAGLARARGKRDEARAYAEKAIRAVDAAKALLASLDGDAPDAADASEGAANG